MLKGIFGGSHGMLIRSLRGTEWQQFLDYVSPSFLEVMPMGQLLAQGREIAGNAMQGARFARLRGQTDAALAARGIAVRVVAPEDAGETGGVAALAEDDRRALGQLALEIYFAQLYAEEWSILDLRASRFARRAAGQADWFPRPMYLRWDPDFLEGIREMYQGFYREDDERFQRGLARLELESAGDVLQSHFGGGDQRAVRFDSKVFHSTFHDAFVRAREAGVSLHRNFLALGLYLACLYDALETLDLEFDVRAAFERAAPAASDAAPAGAGR